MSKIRVHRRHRRNMSRDILVLDILEIPESVKMLTRTGDMC